VVFTVTMVLVFYWLLKKIHVVWPWIFTLLFITLNGLNFRLSLIKANSLSLLVIFLLLYALFKQKKWLMALLGFIFIWLYGGWPLAILITLIYLITDNVYNYYHSNRLKLLWHKVIRVFTHQPNESKNIKLLVWLLLGLLAGLIINPYWPQNLYFYYQQIIQIGIINLGNQFPVGGEWYGTDLITLISAVPHIFVTNCLIFILLIFRHKKISRQTWFSFALMFIFLLLTIKSRRYVEYFMPFALLFTACGITDLKKITNWEKIVKIWQGLRLYLKIYLIVALLAFATLVMPTVIRSTIDTQIPQHLPFDKFQLATNWLKNNTPENSIIFHSDWDEWPILFYHNDHNYYLVGLDPTFMHNFDARLHQRFIDLSTGQIIHNPARQIKDAFGAEFIFVEKNNHTMLIQNLDNDLYASLVYEDSDTRIYKIN